MYLGKLTKIEVSGKAPLKFKLRFQEGRDFKPKEMNVEEICRNRG